MSVQTYPGAAILRSRGEKPDAGVQLGAWAPAWVNSLVSLGSLLFAEAIKAGQWQNQQPGVCLRGKKVIIKGSPEGS